MSESNKAFRKSSCGYSKMIQTKKQTKPTNKQNK